MAEAANLDFDFSNISVCRQCRYLCQIWYTYRYSLYKGHYAHPTFGKIQDGGRFKMAAAAILVVILDLIYAHI